MQATRIYQWISGVLDVPKDKCYFYNDNVAALYWLRGDPDKQVTFVSNRTKRVKAADITFGYGETGHNPADIGTRPAFVQDLQDPLWLKGPSHLRQEELPPSRIDFDNFDVDKALGLKKTHALPATTLTTVRKRPKSGKPLPSVEQYDTLEKAIHMYALILWLVDILKEILH